MLDSRLKTTQRSLKNSADLHKEFQSLKAETENSAQDARALEALSSDSQLFIKDFRTLFRKAKSAQSWGQQVQVFYTEESPISPQKIDIPKLRNTQYAHVPIKLSHELSPSSRKDLSLSFDISQSSLMRSQAIQQALRQTARKVLSKGNWLQLFKCIAREALNYHEKGSQNYQQYLCAVGFDMPLKKQLSLKYAPRRRRYDTPDRFFLDGYELNTHTGKCKSETGEEEVKCKARKQLSKRKVYRVTMKNNSFSITEETLLSKAQYFSLEDIEVLEDFKLKFGMTTLIMHDEGLQIYRTVVLKQSRNKLLWEMVDSAHFQRSLVDFLYDEMCQKLYLNFFKAVGWLVPILEIKIRPRLTRISIKNSFASQFQFNKLLDVLTAYDQLTHVDLSSNTFSKAFLQKYFYILRVNSNVSSMILSKCALNDRDFVDLLQKYQDVLKRPWKLIDLSFNLLTTTSIIKLSKLLKSRVDLLNCTKLPLLDQAFSILENENIRGVDFSYTNIRITLDNLHLIRQVLEDSLLQVLLLKEVAIEVSADKFLSALEGCLCLREVVMQPQRTVLGVHGEWQICMKK